MDLAKELIFTLKEKNKSHVGYGLQKECEALVGHILQNMVKSHLPEFIPETKNSEDSIKYREEGNQHFVMGDDIDAIKSYTMSLAFANSQELMSSAFANRSAALYRQKMYRECLIDIDAALDMGYPQEKRKKLKERGDKAIEEMKKNIDTVEDDMDELKDINQFTLSQNINITMRHGKLKDKTIIDDEITLNKSLEKDKESLVDSIAHLETTSKIPRYLDNEGSLQLTYGSSKEAPANSEGVAITFSEKFGRHLVATRNLNPGDIITMEEPYVHVIYEDRYYTHCHYCLSRCYNLIPCSECPISLYCSEKCRKLGWKHIHKTECRILPLLKNLFNLDKDKIRILSKIVRLLIVVTNNGLKFQELQKDMSVAESNPDSRTAGFTDEGTFNSFNTRCALSLATNMTTRPLVGISAFACISALAAMLLATQTNFFAAKFQVEQLKDISRFSDLKFCASLMFRASVIMSSNCFSIQQEPGLISGSGLYVTHSLYNHSCAPNTLRHFNGLTMITRALEPIAAGEQILTSYGPGYAYMKRTDRKSKIMEDYFFDCECRGCKYDWPMYSEILKNHTGSISKIKRLVEKLKPFKKRLLENMYDIDAVKSVLHILHQEVTQPCEEIVHAEQYLKSYYLGKFK